MLRVPLRSHCPTAGELDFWQTPACGLRCLGPNPAESTTQGWTLHKRFDSRRECDSATKGNKAGMGSVARASSDESLESSRVGQLAVSLGCSADLEAITQALLVQTALGKEAYAAVWSSVDHLVNHDIAWRSMVQGVVPPSLRAQALAVTHRTDATKPADSVPAAVLAAVGSAIMNPGHSTSRAADRPAGSRRASAVQVLPRISAGLLLRVRALFASRIRPPDEAANLNS